MEPLVLFTDDRALLPSVEAAASGLGTTVYVCTQLEELPQTHVPIILWFPVDPDEAILLQIIEHCDQVIQFFPRSSHQERLCPIRSVGAPHYYLAVPCDPEELQALIEGLLQRIAQKKAQAQSELDMDAA